MAMGFLTDALYLRQTFFTHKGDYPLVRRDYGSTSGICFQQRVTGVLNGNILAFLQTSVDLIENQGRCTVTEF
ncbi:hypothetical protein [Kaistella sp.]|uniref:hypothetical protein n=1 Tax=Kaistella sp. TaxID=2782235 RepID=UPI002F92FE3E